MLGSLARRPTSCRDAEAGPSTGFDPEVAPVGDDPNPVDDRVDIHSRRRRRKPAQLVPNDKAVPSGSSVERFSMPPTASARPSDGRMSIAVMVFAGCSRVTGTREGASRAPPESKVTSWFCTVTAMPTTRGTSASGPESVEAASMPPSATEVEPSSLARRDPPTTASKNPSTTARTTTRRASHAPSITEKKPSYARGRVEEQEPRRNRLEDHRATRLVEAFRHEAPRQPKREGSCSPARECSIIDGLHLKNANRPTGASGSSCWSTAYLEAETLGSDTPCTSSISSSRDVEPGRHFEMSNCLNVTEPRG